MARPLKTGLDYFPFDVDLFTDKKIKRLRASYGNDGICVYLYILSLAYRDKGYYVELDEDLILDISDELNITENLTRQIVVYLLSRSLLDEKLAESVKVLTAASIQRRFQEAKRSSKREVSVRAELWLLKKSETLSFIKVCPDNGFSGNNENNSRKNNSLCRQKSLKERKGKESKGEERKEDDLLTPDQRRELEGMSSVESVGLYIEKIKRWQQRSGKEIAAPYSVIKKWIAEDKAKARERQEYDIDDVEEFAMSYVIKEDDP